MEIRKASQRDVSVLCSLIRASFKNIAEKFALTESNCPKHPSNCTKDWVISDLKISVKRSQNEVS